MRVTAKAQRPVPSGVAEGVPMPAPTGGWDGISALANMPPDRAYALDNWIPRPGWIEPRKGYIAFSTGVGSPTTPVQTVMAYNGAGSVNNLFGVAGGTIYDCTIAGAAVPTSVTGLTSSRLQYLIFTNASSAQQYLMAVNGGSAPLCFNGSAWSTSAITVASGSYAFDPTSFVQIASHKGRLWFVPANSTNAVYLTTEGGYQGTGYAFPLGQFMTRGGYLQAIGTWTVDSSQTVDEYIAFITSRGQVIVYQGTDPSTSATWSLVGVYNLGRPLGRRCFIRMAGNLFIITIDGIVPMTEMLSGDRVALNKISPTANILYPMTQAAQNYGTFFGWQMIEYAKGTLAILNIPIAENSAQMQFVMNTITGAWARFYDASSRAGIPANCWEVDALDNVYFGGNNGTLYQWDVSSGDAGAPINCLVKTAYNAFGNAAQLKRYTMLQPLITTSGNPIPNIGINVDFNDNAQLSMQQAINPNFPQWGKAVWGQFVWPALQTSASNWISVLGLGHYVSIVTQVQTAPIPGNPTAAVTLQLNGWNVTAERGAWV